MNNDKQWVVDISQATPQEMQALAEFVGYDEFRSTPYDWRYAGYRYADFGYGSYRTHFDQVEDDKVFNSITELLDHYSAKEDEVAEPKASDVQIGGEHYKVWKVQPYILMAFLPGPAAHIAGYLLRKKGDDDLDKALHWCKLAHEAKTLELGVEFTPEQQVKAVMYCDAWCYYNDIYPSSINSILRELAIGCYETAHHAIQELKDERAGL